MADIHGRRLLEQFHDVLDGGFNRRAGAVLCVTLVADGINHVVVNEYHVICPGEFPPIGFGIQSQERFGGDCSSSAVEAACKYLAARISAHRARPIGKNGLSIGSELQRCVRQQSGHAELRKRR